MVGLVHLVCVVTWAREPKEPNTPLPTVYMCVERRQEDLFTLQQAGAQAGGRTFDW